ncbi:hypothetical protein NUW58_g8733 [Xylaria curta]|uniref:Uncharacterized protein n=1 Tax=Xylaria curta TaxID=42375 RepID=A0ACC1N558_9PEZI|nr:hypothetical protein NUW58_g8733 [Xylaria curta]
MAALFGAAHRNWLLSHPSTVPKSSKPLVFGILGAADIGPPAIILPAKSHEDVIIQTVAARDPAKATMYARKYGIQHVAKTYQDVLDDPNINCVYIPLPNGLHYVWAQRALKAGKHVLLEKPSVNNSTEAERLFLPPTPAPPSSPSASTQPVLLEAVHSLFHPAWALFMSHVTPSAVASAKSSLWVPRWFFGPDNIRYNFELGGGALMDLGSYTASALTRIFGSVAEECVDCETVPHAEADPRCDRRFRARYRFPNGGVGEMEGDLKAPLLKLAPEIYVMHKPIVVDSAEAGVEIKEGERVLRTREIHFVNFVQPSLVHSITVSDQFSVQEIVSTGIPPRKSWKKTKTLKAYTWREAGISGSKTQPGEPHWSTYRYQLEQFVNKIHGRDTPQWVEGKDSVDTMRMIDMAYTRAKLPLRPTSEEPL